MKRIFFVFTIALLFSGTIIILLNSAIFQNNRSSDQFPVSPEQKSGDTHPDAFNMTYNIEGTPVVLTEGTGSIRDDITGTETRYALYKKPIFGDIGNDGDADAIVIITVESGGTGTFYYGVTVENSGDSFRASNALYLGDRIIPEYITIQGNDVFFTFLDRTKQEAMVVEPSHERILKATYNTDHNMLLEL